MTDLNPSTPGSEPQGSTASALRAKAAPKLKAAAASAHDAYDHLKEAAVETLGETKERLQNVVGQTGQQAQVRYDDLEAYVQLRPLRALGIAAAAGVLVGLLLRGSSKTVYLRDAR